MSKKYSDRNNFRSDIQINKIYGQDNHERNVDRLDFERNIMFNQNSNINSDEKSMYSNQSSNSYRDPNVGEITGSKYEIGCGGTDRGLPMRSQYTIKKQSYDPNDHLNFDLFDDRPSKLKVKSNDPIESGNLCNYADISSSVSKISTQINPVVINSNGIDRLNNNAFYYLFDIMENNNYVVNGMGLYNLFASLYIISNNETEIETKKFFEFPKKDVLFKGLITINDKLDLVGAGNMIVMKNFMLIGSDVPYNPQYYDTIKDFCILAKIDITNKPQEAYKLNELIRKTMHKEMRNSITVDNITNLQLMFLTTAVIKPIWRTSFDKISTGIFYGNDGKTVQCNFLHSIGQTYGYYENNDNQLLEIICDGNNLAMGCLLFKNELNASVDDIKLHFYISHLKECVLDEVVIPMFKQDFKLRFNNTLKNMGLQTVFMNIKSSTLFSEGITLQDVVQNVKIIIGNSYGTTQRANKGHRSNKKFIADRPFIFYFRLVKTNTFIVMGIYQ